MKFSVATILAFSTSASAFMGPASQTRQSVSVNVLSEPPLVVEAVVEPVVEPVVVEPKIEPVVAAVETPAVKEVAPAPARVDPKQQIQPGRYNDINYSRALPFFARPTKLDGSHAGDFGFDPCGFTEEYDMHYLQECELRHARLAMLAVVGWPASELVAPSWMLQNGCAPSVLNGVNPLSFLSVATVFGALGYFEYKTALRRTAGTKLGDIHNKDMEQIWDLGVAGDYNFDPQGFYSTLGDNAWGRRAIRDVEVTQGRMAMVGITYFAAWEKLTGTPIVANNPFFHPNAVLPLAVVSYFAWSQFYQVSDPRKYPITIEYTKDGEEMLRGIQRTVAGQESEIEAVVDSVKEVADKTIKTAKGAVDKLIELQESA